MIAWFAVVFGINSTHNAVNCTWLRLMQLLSVLVVLLIPNTTAKHAITYTIFKKRLLNHAFWIKLPKIIATDTDMLTQTD